MVLCIQEEGRSPYWTINRKGVAMEIVSLERNSNGRVGRFIKREVYGRGILAGFKTSYGWAFGTLSKSQFNNVLFNFHSTKTVRDRIKAMEVKVDEVVLNDRGYIDWELTRELAEAPMRFKEEHGFSEPKPVVEEVEEEIVDVAEVSKIAVDKKEVKPLTSVVIGMHIGREGVITALPEEEEVKNERVTRAEARKVVKKTVKPAKARKTTKKNHICKGVDYDMQALRMEAVGNLIYSGRSVDEGSIVLEVARIVDGKGRKVA